MRQLALLVSLSLVSGCSPKVRDFPRDQGAGGGGSGSGGGGGGGSSSSHTSSSVTSGSGGGACVDPATQCPPPQSACIEAACVDGACAERPRPARTPCGEDGGAECDGSGACVACDGRMDCGMCAEPGCPHTCGSTPVMDMPPSCADRGPGAGDSCGDGADESCCGSTMVPCGTYLRSHDGESSADDAFPAAVSDFRLDRYEITVGRFRAFVKAGHGVQASPPAIGVGRHPHVDGSGWIAGWNRQLEPDTAALRSALKCNGDNLWTWTDEPGANEELPINCITWFEAFAFCAWDGGRLPSEAEWNYAASGGDEHRKYPWGADIDVARAAYNCTGDGSAAGSCALSDILPVGSKPSGDGRWGHADLAGNVWELVMDWWSEELFTPCIDCVERADGERDAPRVHRGGSFRAPAADVRAANREPSGPTDRVNNIGARCARDL
ncbi:formylglycine-generating enzyme family protein [Sorangium sp. So ce429]